MSTPLHLFSYSDNRPADELPLPSKPPNAWILYRIDRMKEIMQEQRNFLLSFHQLGGASSTVKEHQRFALGALAPDARAFNYLENGTERPDADEDNLHCHFAFLGPEFDGTAHKIAQGSRCSQAQISKMVSKMWKYERKEVKEHYHRLATERKLEHQKHFSYQRCQAEKDRKIKQFSKNTWNSHSMTTSEQADDGIDQKALRTVPSRQISGVCSLFSASEYYSDWIASPAGVPAKDDQRQQQRDPRHFLEITHPADCANISQIPCSIMQSTCFIDTSIQSHLQETNLYTDSSRNEVTTFQNLIDLDDRRCGPSLDEASQHAASDQWHLGQPSTLKYMPWQF